MRYGRLLAPIVAMAAMLAAPTGALAATGPHLSCIPTQPNGTPILVGVADNVRSLCLLRGQELSVVLSVDPSLYPNPANWWSPITESGTALTLLPITALPVQGTTLGHFQAVHRGFASVASTLNICPGDAGHACGAPVLLWRVNVEVAGRR